jgi:hypothetical protein
VRLEASGALKPRHQIWPASMDVLFTAASNARGLTLPCEPQQAAGGPECHALNNSCARGAVSVVGNYCGQKLLFHSGPKEPFGHPRCSANLSLHHERFRPAFQALNPPTEQTTVAVVTVSQAGCGEQSQRGFPMKQLLDSVSLFDSVSELLNAGLSTEQIIALVRQAASAPVADLTKKS